MKHIFFTLSIVALIYSCKSTQNIITVEEAKIPQTQYELIKEHKWVLESFLGQTPEEAGFKERMPYITVDKEAQRIGGFTGCNSFGGDAQVTDTTIKAGMMMATKAFCQGVPEPEFFKNLEESTSYEIKGNQLLFLKGETILMTFRSGK